MIKTVTITLISTCTNRKRRPAQRDLRARNLPHGDAFAVAREWTRRIDAAPKDVLASDLYAGRTFTEATRAAAKAKARLLIVSAGLGLITTDSLVPGYDLTLAVTSEDSVLAKTKGSSDAWWTALNSSRASAEPDFSGEELILAALSRPYLQMVGSDWAKWPAERLARLRLFSKDLPKDLPSVLADAWIPYDDRLDQAPGDYAGTQSDFAQRALRHFVETVGGQVAPIATQRLVVETALSALTHRQIPSRLRTSDEEILRIIQRDWDLVDGRSGAMLRRLRDRLSIACEQTRFKHLFKSAAALRQRPLL